MPAISYSASFRLSIFLLWLPFLTLHDLLITFSSFYIGYILFFILSSSLSLNFPSLIISALQIPFIHLLVLDSSVLRLASSSIICIYKTRPVTKISSFSLPFLPLSPVYSFDRSLSSPLNPSRQPRDGHGKQDLCCAHLACRGTGVRNRCLRIRISRALCSFGPFRAGYSRRDSSH